jgi:hypothetical protein
MEQKQLMIKMVLDNWYSTIANTDKLLSSLTDEQLQADIAPGRNSGVYLLGHLTAVHDRMLPLLGFGEQAFPQFNDAFLTSPDKSGKTMPEISELRKCWSETNAKLDTHFKNLQPDEWLQKHTAVSEGDFAKEPHRNRLNVVLGRTTHLSNHLGQMLLLTKKTIAD